MPDPNKLGLNKSTGTYQRGLESGYDPSTISHSAAPPSGMPSSIPGISPPPPGAPGGPILHEETLPPLPGQVPLATTPPAGTPSVDALNKVVEPDTAQGGLEGGLGLSLGALGASTGGGNQERTGSAQMGGGGYMRSLGRRMPSQETLTLPRKAY